MKKIKLISLLIAVLLTMSCAAGANPLVTDVSDVAGFWKGLWHGFIILFSFIVSLFNENVSIYEVNNNGGWYNFGFLLGAMSFWGGGGNSTCKSVRARKTED